VTDGFQTAFKRAVKYVSDIPDGLGDLTIYQRALLIYDNVSLRLEDAIPTYPPLTDEDEAFRRKIPVEWLFRGQICEHQHAPAQYQ
jgi:hypothetical protein